MYRYCRGRNPKAFARLSFPSKMEGEFERSIKKPQKQFKGQVAIKTLGFPQHLLF